MSPDISLTQAPRHARHGSNIGQPLTRREGVLKVKGEPRYAADNHPPGMLHDVLGVRPPANRPPLAEDPDANTSPFMFRLDLLQNGRVRYANQSIAVVIAET